jgi:hypothetical protein
VKELTFYVQCDNLSSFCFGGQKLAKNQHSFLKTEYSVTNFLCLENSVTSTASLTPAVDWLDSLIGPGGLLLLDSSHLIAVPVLVLRLGLRKCK